MVGQLIIMRHGQSEWTRPNVNRFAGWVDVDLSTHGRQQAKRAGELLTECDIYPDLVFTSVLRRSIITANLILDKIDRLWIPVERSWRLNERHYGAFQGQTRPAMLKQYGTAAFKIYRRSYDVAPPAIARNSPYSQANDPRYGSRYKDHIDAIEPARITAESLQDLQKRFYPYWEARIAPQILAGKTVLVVTHGSVVRVLIKMLEHISQQAIRNVNVPTGVPMIYRFTTSPAGRLVPLKAGEYLDPDAATSGIAQVVALGETSKNT
ncbi:2,3-bisphosphoglycerate-dependent phosphoglycerate mutase [Bombiscardovia coagulans]|uniref:2,3-bisphosphoglycerate-dependent phosphoglycerate mutase n=1 Tax=Bombiscardovia coagulans TaxID=686666 RepID=A0A261EVP2_9BIFI|nr:2,3-bisphosphoglycerate-dependent phosphoglycerate mutase [Bombiscardovia coagulans]OZG50928.1 phosphoglyceromutase [Bombiscardovia coagulans]